MNSENETKLPTMPFGSVNPTGHPCPTCGKRFRQKGDLYLHQVSQGESHRVSCSQCQKSFTSDAYLAKHMRVVHKDGNRGRHR